MSILVKKVEERGEVMEKLEDLRTNTNHGERNIINQVENVPEEGTRGNRPVEKGNIQKGKNTPEIPKAKKRLERKRRRLQNKREREKTKKRGRHRGQEPGKKKTARQERDPQRSERHLFSSYQQSGEETGRERRGKGKTKRPKKDGKARRKKYMNPRRKRSGRRDKRKSTSRRRPSEVEEYTVDSESEEKIRTKTQRPTKRRERPRIPSALHSSEETVEKLKGRPSHIKHQKRSHIPPSKQHKKGDLITDKKRRARRHREKSNKTGRPRGQKPGKRKTASQLLND
ncbi:hypothetical protein TNCT_544421 [Trichonephila clavata]|uniref:Uncharacterized protein n=1 Tax=Trichonephila clavata TaxID=2740835 RepID=A0A8X6G951_TRICU|nr:hypothetical protein TNCT_544421 [Trichonephila clavata]